MSGELGDIYNVLHAMSQSGASQDMANQIAADPNAFPDAPGAPVGSGINLAWSRDNSGPVPVGLAGIAQNRQQSALSKVGQDAISGNIDAPTALQKVSQITGGDPTKLIGMVSQLRAYGLMPQANPQPSTVSSPNPMAQQAPALASMGGVQSAPVMPMLGGQGSGGDSTPNLPAPSNVAGSGQYPGLVGASGILNPKAAMPSNAGPVAIGTSQVESGGRDYNPDGSMVTSPKGAQAAMQVMPSTQANPGFGVTPAKDNSPAEIDRVGVDYRNALLQRYDGNQQLASAAYNAGPGRVDAALQQAGGDPNKAISMLPQETQDYIPKVAAATAPLTQQQQIMQAAVLNGQNPLEMQTKMAALAKDQADTNLANMNADKANWEMGGQPSGGSGGGALQQSGNSAQPISGLGGKAAQEVAQKEAEEKNTNKIAAQKNASLMLSNLPVMNNQFDKLRAANEKSSFSPVNDEEGNGIITTLHGMGGRGNIWTGTEGDETSKANSQVKTLAAQNVIREIAPQLSQNGIKGNKFLETLINSASGVDLNTSKGARASQVDLLQNNYNQGLKSVLSQVKSLGGDPTELIHQAFPDGKGLGDAVRRGAIDKQDALDVYRKYHGAK